MRDFGVILGNIQEIEAQNSSFKVVWMIRQQRCDPSHDKGEYYHKIIYSVIEKILSVTETSFFL